MSSANRNNRMVAIEKTLYGKGDNSPTEDNGSCGGMTAYSPVPPFASLPSRNYLTADELRQICEGDDVKILGEKICGMA